MLKLTVVMPTRNRPEFLALSLEKIQLALSESALDVKVQIYLDHGGNSSETNFVRDCYLPKAEIIQQPEHLSVPSGCWNILNALKSGFETGSDVVCLIEEDVMVFPDYFNVHEMFQWAMHPLPGAVCGREIVRYGKDYYTNPGSSLSHSLLSKIVPHINDEFFNDSAGYMLKKFPEWPEASPLDDGLIRRVIREQKAEIMYQGRTAVHQGYRMYGKNDDNRTSGTIEERIQQLRTILSKIDCEDRYYRDFEPYDRQRKIPALG
jgi:hypothetical protein